MNEAAPVVATERLVVVRVSGLRKDYRRRPAVQGIDLTVGRGEIYGLIGPDGAGKSTLLKALAGVLTFDGGLLEVFGLPVASERAAEHVKGRIGFMPQGLGLHLYPELSVEENIDFFARLRMVPPASLAERKRILLGMTRLDRFRDRPMKHLSGGMKQKLGLACTLIHEPELVILDEPTTGVDPVSRRDFWTILSTLVRERAITALVSTAYLDEASRFHRVALLQGGRVLAEGEPEEIRALVPGSLVTLRAPDQAQAFARLKTRFPQVQALGPWLRVFVDGAGTVEASAHAASALDGFVTGDLLTGEPELEDVFVALLRRRNLMEEAPPEAERRPAPAAAAGHDGVAIEARDLTRDFGKFRAVDRVSFQVRQGEIFGLLGANGAGKTTVIKMLTGILHPTAGAGHVAGADMRRAGRDIKQRIGYVSQAFSLYTDLTVVENIRLYAGIYGLDAAETRAREAWILEMGRLGGHERELAGNLPMGMRQRLALGCALVHRPQVLFLDEPTSGVDPVGRRQFWDILFRLSREEGVAILVTTHYMSEAEHCDRVALMFAGRIVADAPPSDLKRQVEEEAGRVLEVETDQPVLALDRLSRAGFEDAALFGRRIHLFSKSPEGDRARIPGLLAADGIRVSSVTLLPLSMEDVFVYRIGALEDQARAARGGPR